MRCLKMPCCGSKGSSAPRPALESADGDLIGEGREQSPQLSIARLCQTLAVSRAAYSRWEPLDPSADPDMEARDQSQNIALEMPASGDRRIIQELQRRGHLMTHKRVLRLMRTDNLLCLRTRSFVRTTDFQHDLGISPNLLLTLMVDGLDQLWVADITYVRLPHEFVSLAVLLEAELALAALRMALAARTIRPGLVHHSDRGVQYASHAYTHLLKEHGMRISMRRAGNPDDHAQAESFIKTLKCDEVHLFGDLNFAEAHGRIGQCIEEVYNQKRLHSALGYRPPVEFERWLGP